MSYDGYIEKERKNLQMCEQFAGDLKRYLILKDNIIAVIMRVDKSWLRMNAGKVNRDTFDSYVDKADSFFVCIVERTFSIVGNKRYVTFEVVELLQMYNIWLWTEPRNVY